MSEKVPDDGFEKWLQRQGNRAGEITYVEAETPPDGTVRIPVYEAYWLKRVWRAAQAEAYEECAKIAEEISQRFAHKVSDVTKAIRERAGKEK